MLTFKTPELKAEFLAADPRIRFIVHAVASYTWVMFGKETVVTCVYRPGKGVHAYNCGVDLRTTHLNPGEGNAILREFNGHLEYDPRRPTMNVVHDERALEDQSADATEQHFHVQVWPGSNLVTLYREFV